MNVPLETYSIFKSFLIRSSSSKPNLLSPLMSRVRFGFGLPNTRAFVGCGKSCDCGSSAEFRTSGARMISSRCPSRPQFAKSDYYSGDQNLLRFHPFKKRSKSKLYFRSMSQTQNSNNNDINGKRPGLIVFDLDYTLWPYHVDSTVALPFCTKSSKIYDQSGQEIKPFPEVPEVLEFLIKEGFTLAAASRTTKPPGAFQLLELLDWNKYFTYKEIYPGSKITHFERFAEQTKLQYESMMFFDDEERNIREVSQLGVICIFVPNGLNMKLMTDSIVHFQERHL